MLRVLITGASGKLGRELKRLVPQAYTPTHQELDIRDRKNVFKYIDENAIDTIIHCAALTNIRYCEMNREKTFDVNVKGTRNLRDALFTFDPKNCYFIYVSTACVFPGDDSEHFDSGYSETDIPYPKNFYALTKLLGEIILMEVAEVTNVWILRTNFIGRGKWSYPKAFVDRYANYLYIDQVAEEIKKLMEKKMTGIVHICGDRQASIFDFARLTDPDVKPMTIREYHGPPLTVNMTLKSICIPHVHFEVKMI